MDNPSPARGQTSKPAKFLLVDDEPAVLRALKRLIESACQQWVVVCARHGEEALERLAETQFDAVVLDLQMPTMDGMTLLRNMIRLHPETVRIVHSSHTETLGTELVRYLAHNVVPKPATAHQILNVLRWAVQGGGSVMREDPRKSSAVCA